MEQILKPNEGILGILGNPKASQSPCRLLHFCVSKPVDEGTLLFNVLTRELLLLTDEEFAHAEENDYLRRHWFVVPRDTNDKQLADTVQWIRKTMQPAPKHTTGYTILTTTDCNARCFYCYEMGRPRIPMSEETARKTAAFIRDNCGGKEVRIGWFGGEPLYNCAAIDTICDCLRTDGIPFRCSMISNGYLFDDAMIEKAATRWNLQKVQITLDGTEEVYNRCKAYIYKEGSAFRIVTDNIGRLLDRGIRVSIRMNMDFHNTEDLMALVEQLAERFGGKGLTAYPHLIFDDKIPWDARYPEEKWTRLYQSMHALEEKMIRLGLHPSKDYRLLSKLPDHSCMANDPTSLVITPRGDLGVCEHFTENELIGHLDSPERDAAVVESFRRRADLIPECATCFFYPQCLPLKKCPDRIACIAPARQSHRRSMEQAMDNEYHLWKHRENA